MEKLGSCVLARTRNQASVSLAQVAASSGPDARRHGVLSQQTLAAGFL